MVDTLHQRELDAGIVELLDVWPAALAGHDGLHFNDLQERGTIRDQFAPVNIPPPL